MKTISSISYPFVLSSNANCPHKVLSLPLASLLNNITLLMNKQTEKCRQKTHKRVSEWEGRSFAAYRLSILSLQKNFFFNENIGEKSFICIVLLDMPIRDLARKIKIFMNEIYIFKKKNSVIGGGDSHCLIMIIKFDLGYFIYMQKRPSSLIKYANNY